MLSNIRILTGVRFHSRNLVFLFVDECRERLAFMSDEFIKVICHYCKFSWDINQIKKQINEELEKYGGFLEVYIYSDKMRMNIVDKKTGDCLEFYSRNPCKKLFGGHPREIVLQYNPENYVFPEDALRSLLPRIVPYKAVLVVDYLNNLMQRIEEERKNVKSASLQGKLLEVKKKVGIAN